jgi:hypothetical protein
MLNVRSGPGTEFPIVGSFAQGSRINILERRDSWLRSEYQGDSNRWVYAEFVAEETPSNVATGAAVNVAVGDTGYAQPILLNPIKQNSVREPLQFEWEWAGTLAGGHGFDVQVWKEGEAPAGIAHPSFVVATGDGHYVLKLPSIPQSKGNDYHWTVRIVQIDTGREVGPSAVPNTFRYE